MLSDFTTWNLLLQIASTWCMVGLIWFVQVVHYPLFSRIGRDQFRRYEMDHQRLTTYVVAPLMFIELFTAILLCWLRPAGLSATPVWAGIGLLAMIWLMTYTVQVPQHASLVVSYDTRVQRQLVRSNWYRTAAWTARGLLVLWMAGHILQGNDLKADIGW